MWSLFPIRKRVVSLLGVGLIAAGLASAAVDPAAGAGETAIIVHTSQGNVSIGSAELQGAYDIFDNAYTIRASDGTEDRLQFSGASIRQVLDLAGIDPDSVGFLETPRSDGTMATLTGPDLQANPPFPDGPPLVFVDGPAVRYLRPVRNASDSNASDDLATQSGEPLELTAHTGNILDVQINASDLAIDKGDSVSFDASASGERSGESIHYSWDFGDGSTDDGDSTTHTFDTQGSFSVVARAEGDQDSAGSSQLLRVVVGPPPKGPGNGDGNGSNHNWNALPNGPRFGNGHHASGHPGGGGNGNGAGNGPKSFGSKSGTGTTPDSGTPPPAGTTPYPAGTTGYVPPSPTSPVLPDLPPSPPTAPDPTKNAPHVAADPSGEPIVGRLLSETTPVADASQPESAGAAAAATGDPPDSAWSPGGLGVGAVLLVCCGAGLELRGGRRSFRMRT